MSIDRIAIAAVEYLPSKLEAVGEAEIGATKYSSSFDDDAIPSSTDRININKSPGISAVSSRESMLCDEALEKLPVLTW